MNSTDPFTNEELNEEWKAKAEEELNETEQNRKQGLVELKNLIIKKNLTDTRTDDAFLLRFLRARKYDIPLTFKMLERYEAKKRTNPELFNMRKAIDNIAIFNSNAQIMLDGRDSSGAKIFLYRIGKFNFNKDSQNAVTNEQVFLSNMLLLEWTSLDPRTQIAGVTILADLTGFSIQKHASLLSPYYTKKSADVIQETFPLRFKGIHIVHQPTYFDTMFALVKPFLKEKVKRRIYLHGTNFEQLHSYIPKEVLPTEYGGELENIDYSAWKQKLIDDIPLILGEPKEPRPKKSLIIRKNISLEKESL